MRIPSDQVESKMLDISVTRKAQHSNKHQRGEKNYGSR